MSDAVQYVPGNDLVDWSRARSPYAAEIVQSESIEFFATDTNKLIMTIKSDGTVTIGPGMKNKKSAKEFLDILTKAFPQWRAGICEKKP